MHVLSLPPLFNVAVTFHIIGFSTWNKNPLSGSENAEKTTLNGGGGGGGGGDLNLILNSNVDK